MTITPPIVVTLDDAGEADVQALLSGSGPLAQDVEEVVRAIRQRTAHQNDARVLLPIVAVYERTKRAG
jgi:hypothetical protein